MAIKNSYLGVDLGSISIKIVELKNEAGTPKLLTYGYSEQPAEITSEGKEGEEERIASLINKIRKKAQMKSDQAVAAMPSFSVFSSIINLPKMSSKDLKAAVYWEAKKVVPMPIEEVVLDWKALEEKPEKIKDYIEEGSILLPNIIKKTKVMLASTIKSSAELANYLVKKALLEVH